MGCKEAKWTLDDGTITTTIEVAEKLGTNIGTAYSRLKRSKDPKVVYKPLPEYRFTNGKREKLYTLDDGSKWTAREVAKAVGCKRGTASSRLCTMTDPAKVLEKPSNLKKPSKAIEKIIKERMYFDPLGHWKLLMKNT